VDATAAQLVSLEGILKQAEASAQALLVALESHINATAEEATAEEEVVVAEQRPGTDREGRCTSHRDNYGSAYLLFKVCSQRSASNWLHKK
jgi:hypothetical protein